MVDGLLLYYQQIGFVRYISGSQLAVWYYRALGAKIGQGVLLNGLHRYAGFTVCSRWVLADYRLCHVSCMFVTHVAVDFRACCSCTA